jgi:hypothetical protein
MYSQKEFVNNFFVFVPLSEQRSLSCSEQLQCQIPKWQRRKREPVFIGMNANIGVDEC